MARKSSGGALWGVAGALVLFAMVPKEVWIGLAVVGTVSVVAFAAIKILGAYTNFRSVESDAQASAKREPTLAELTARYQQGQQIKKRVGTRVSASERNRSAYKDSPAADERVDRQSRGWIDRRNSVVQGNRQRADELRGKFASNGLRADDLHVWSATKAVGVHTPTRPKENDPKAEILTRELGRPSDRLDPRVEAQPEAWKKRRDIFAQENHQRSEYLRDKFPPESIPTTAAGNAIGAKRDESPPLHFISSDSTEVEGSPPEWTGRSHSETIQPPNIADDMSYRARDTSNETTEDQLAGRRELTLANFMDLLKGKSGSDTFYAATPTSQQGHAATHSIPHAPEGFGTPRWITPAETVQIAGLTLRGGMFYFGSRLKAANGSTEPALISPQLDVARIGDFRERHMDYWPSYAEISSTARRAYLSWLAEGRSHPDCDIGYVFLFFYGLERRVILDTRDDEAIKSEWPDIINELRRLLGIYGEKFGSFRRYAGELLSWIELDGVSSHLYEQPIPDLPQSYELPPYLRLALGQASLDRAPVPAPLALAWVQHNPGSYLRTAATRCPEEFERLFIQRYQEILGPGLMLPKNRTKLKLVYSAASFGFHGASISLSFGDTPDVTALTKPIKTLLEIANQCTDELGSYSRLIGKDESLRGSLESLLLLPATLWPPETQAKLHALTERMQQGRLTLTLQELVTALGGANQPLKRDRVRALARALEGAQIGMEPHVLVGARTPGDTDPVVLFAQPTLDADVGVSAEYQTAALTLQLASAMAQADNDFSDQETRHLRSEIDAWGHLTPAEHLRLHAHLQWLTIATPTLTSLKKKLEPLDQQAREMVAAFMVTLAQSDGFVSPDEVKFLEKIYKALDVEAKRVFSDIHAASTASPATQVADKQGFKLDATRIAALQEDTKRVSALLSSIFTEESLSPEAPPPPEPEATEPADSPLGLDEPHVSLLRLLLSRPQWSRAELEDAAADLELMLDGALEQINEAAFDAYDAPLCEGDDPLDINTELLEKIEA